MSFIGMCKKCNTEIYVGDSFVSDNGELVCAFCTNLKETMKMLEHQKRIEKEKQKIAYSQPEERCEWCGK